MNEAKHASAPPGYKCSDCTMDDEPCPRCYTAWWQARHPDTYMVSVGDSELNALRAELAAMTKTKDAAYEERNRCVALAARMAQRMNLRAGLAVTAIEGWSEDWHGLVHIQLPTGQVSWHFHDLQRALFHDLFTLPFQWDGHTTEEKYRRVDQAFVQVLTRGADAARAQAGDSPPPDNWHEPADGRRLAKHNKDK